MPRFLFLLENWLLAKVLLLRVFDNFLEEGVRQFWGEFGCGFSFGRLATFVGIWFCIQFYRKSTILKKIFVFLYLFGG